MLIHDLCECACVFWFSIFLSFRWFTPFLFCFVLFVCVLFTNFTHKNIIVHTACEHIQLQTQQTIRTAQFISSSLSSFPSMYWMRVLFVYKCRFHLHILQKLSPHICGKRCSTPMCVAHQWEAVSVCVRALWLHIIGLCIVYMPIWVCVSVKWLSQPTSYAFLDALWCAMHPL